MSAEGRAVRVGLVGCGRLAEVGYVPALRVARGVRLVGVAEPDPSRRANIAALAGGVPGYPDAAALLDAGGLDALVLATPVAAHLDGARLAVAAGVAVLVEKPPAPDGPMAAALAALDPMPWVGFNRRFEPGVAKLRAIADDVAADLELELEVRHRGGSWGSHTVADDELLSIGPHLIDLARWIIGGEATSVEIAQLTPTRAEFALEFPRGRARIRCLGDGPYRERAQLRGPDRQVRGRYRRGGLAAALVGRARGRSSPHPLVASLVAQLEAFGRAVRGGAEPTLATAIDGAAVMSTIDAVRSAATTVPAAHSAAEKG